MQNSCGRCKEKVKGLFKVVTGHKLSADLCEKCYNSWFDLRDKVVHDAFHDYLVVNKSK